MKNQNLELKKKNQLDEIGGIPYLIELTELVGSAAHIEYHARIVQQKYIQRELIKTATEIQSSRTTKPKMSKSL